MYHAVGSNRIIGMQVQLCFSMVVIVVMLCVRHVTPYSQRGVVLWLPPLLQLVPTAVLFCKPHWSASMHVYCLLADHTTCVLQNWH